MQSEKTISNIVKSRFLYLIWKNEKSSKHFIVGKLYEDRFEYLDKDSLKESIDNGFEGVPAFDLDKKSHENALKVFMRRLPPKNRTDYDKFLSLYGLDINLDSVKSISDFELLGYTGAYVSGNSFHLTNPFIDIEAPFEFVFRASAFNQYSKNLEDHLEINSQLSLKLERDNIFDNRAIQIVYKDIHIAYIPRGLIDSFHFWLKRDYKINLYTYRINGSSSYQYLYVFAELG